MTNENLENKVCLWKPAIIAHPERYNFTKDFPFN